MVRTIGTGDFTENITVSGSVIAPTGTFGESLTVSGVPVATGTDHAALSNLEFASAGHTGFASEASLLSTSGSLQTQINSIDASVTLQEAYDNGDGSIASTPAKPVQVGPLTATGVLKIPDGVAGDPSLTFNSDTNTGIHKVGNSILGIAVRNVTRLTVSGASGSPKGVGILGDLTVTQDVAADAGDFTDRLTVSGNPVVTSLSGMIESENGFFFQTVTGVVTLIERAAYARSITDFMGRTSSGTVSGTLSIDGTDVDGISNRTWNTSQATDTATGSNSIPVGGRVLLTLSGESDFERFGWSYSTERV